VRVRGRAAPASGRAPGTGERGRRALGGRALTLEGGAFRVCTRCGPSVSDCALNY